MSVDELLTAVVAFWAIYMSMLWFGVHIERQLAVRKNLLRSWTGALSAGSTIGMSGTSYIGFTLKDYKKVLHVFLITRRHYTFHIVFVFFLVFLFLCLLGLGTYTAFVTWHAFSFAPAEISMEEARIVIPGHIILLISTALVWPFFRLYEGLYYQTYYEINEKGVRMARPDQNSD